MNDGPLKFALCNDVLQPLPFEEQCRAAAALGYDGLQVAPSTLAADPLALTDAQATHYQRVAQEHGLRIFGLHRLLAAPPGLSIVDADASVRERTLAAMGRMVDLCALMGGNYLVHGSPRQRSVPPGSAREQALARATECFARVADHARQRGVVYCIKPLAAGKTDLINTVAEAAHIVDAVASPGLKTMIDCSAAGQQEGEFVEALIARWVPSGHIAHVQANDPSGRGPGQGELRFAAILQTLLHLQRDGEYQGIVAVAPSESLPDGSGCAGHSLGYLKGIVEGLTEND